MCVTLLRLNHTSVLPEYQKSVKNYILSCSITMWNYKKTLSRERHCIVSCGCTTSYLSHISTCIVYLFPFYILAKCGILFVLAITISALSHLDNSLVVDSLLVCALLRIVLQLIEYKKEVEREFTHTVMLWLVHP